MASRIIFGALIALNLYSNANAVTIHNDRGGEVIGYSIRAQKMKSVRFNGACISACTLYLMIQDKCITPRAKFGFHLAYGASERVNKAATQHMWAKYPQWVRDWITAQGGLTSRMIYMPYSYAGKFIRGC